MANRFSNSTTSALTAILICVLIGFVTKVQGDDLGTRIRMSKNGSDELVHRIKRFLVFPNGGLVKVN